MALKGISQPVRWRAGEQLQVVISYLKGRLYAQEHEAALLTALVQGWPGGRQRGCNHKAGREGTSLTVMGRSVEVGQL